jgi:hypothetical protein
MKQLLCLISALLIIISTYSQDKLKGIGSFKIGEYKIDQLMGYAKENRLKTKIINNRSDEVKIKNDKKNFAELIPNKENRRNSPVYSILCDGVRVFILTETKINDIKVNNLKLSFKDNLLYDLHCDYSIELGNAIETKYGKGESKIEDQATSCGKETTIQTIWNNENIQASANQKKSFNSLCEVAIRSYFDICDLQVTIDVHKRTAEKEKAFDEEKKKTLSNF